MNESTIQAFETMTALPGGTASFLQVAEAWAAVEWESDSFIYPPKTTIACDGQCLGREWLAFGVILQRQSRIDTTTTHPPYRSHRGRGTQ